MHDICNTETYLTRILNYAGLTAEEVTAKRREQRMQFKVDRARAIAQAAEEAEAVFAEKGVVLTETSVAIPSGATWKPPPKSSTDSDLQVKSPGGGAPETANDIDGLDIPEEEEEEIKDVEHLQLTLQEAFFLVWTMDCLTIMDQHTVGAKFYQCDIPH